MSCFICKEDATVKTKLNYSEIQCRRCGEYIINDRSPETLIGELNEEQIANISFWTHDNENPIIDSSNIETLKKLKTPTIEEKAKRIIIHFSKLNPKPGLYIKQNLNTPSFWSKIGCYDFGELEYLINVYLSENKGFIKGELRKDGVAGFKITPEGWAYLETLNETNSESQIGFVAMWFDESFQKVYELGIQKGIEEAGYQPLRIDYKEHNNRIDDEIIATIKNSKFLVADFTGQRGGVYFEAGYALGIGLEVIWLCKKEELDDDKIHFDTRQYNFITWEEDKLNELKDSLRFRIERTIGKGSYNN